MSPRLFFKFFTIFLIALAIFPLAIEQFVPQKELLIPKFWVLFGFFSGLTLLIILSAFAMMRISNKASGYALLGGMTLRFLFSMIIALVYISNFKVEPVKFMTNFFYLYFFNTVFEIYCLLRNLRNQNTK